MQIPKRFKLMGIPVRVIPDTTLSKQKGVLGEARYSEQAILLDTEASSKESTEQAFLHELVHWIFFLLGEDDLRNNERLVDTIAHLFYQYLETQEHETDLGQHDPVTP